MAGINENRVFDKTSLEELKDQAAALMDCAVSVTEELKTEAENVRNIAARVPAEARDSALAGAASSLLASLDTQPFETMKTQLQGILDKLSAMVPAYDAASGQVLSELSASAASLKGMVSELTGLIGNGSLTLSLEEFSGKLEEYRQEWQEGALTLSQKMELAMTFLKGMVLTSCFSKDPVNLSTGNFYYEKEDLKIRGLMPLNFKRCYNALDKNGGALGHGWSHSLEVFLTLPKKETGVFVLHKGDGKEVTFRKEERTWRDIHTGRETIEETEEGYRYREGTFLHIFDREGRRTSFEDENGNSLRFTYDETGRLLTAGQGDCGGVLYFAYKENRRLKTVTDHTGRKLSFFYVEGRLDEVEDPEGHTISYRYDSKGRIRAVKNAHGILSVHNEYDEKGRVIRQRFPDKGEMRYEYLDAENKTILTERNGSRITYDQDYKLRNTSIHYDNCREQFTYDSMDHRTSYIDCNGNKTVYEYDNQGNLVKVVDAIGNATKFRYNDRKQLVQTIKADGHIIKLDYDTKGNLSCIENPDGGNISWEYDAYGRPVTIIQADGSKMEIAYDSKGNIVYIQNPDGTTMSYEYDLLNRVIRTEDGIGRVTRYQYDKKDRMTKVIRPDGKKREYGYNESGKLTFIRDFDGHQSYWNYNEIGKINSVTDKQGRTTTFGYDKMWNIAWQKTPEGARTTFQYDQRNRLSEVKGPEGESIHYEYDYNGNTVRQQRGDGSSLSFTYDALNRMTSYTDAEGNVTHYHYDNVGNLVRIVDAKCGVYCRSYDSRGRLLESTDALGIRTSYSYDIMGRLVEKVDGAGRKTKYQYLPGGQLFFVSHPDGRKIFYRYDAAGRLVEKENEQGYRVAYTYDCLDRTISIESNQGQKKTYEYDAMGNVTEMTDARGNKTRYIYTPTGQLAGVEDAMRGRASYWYDKDDRLIAMLQTGENDPGEMYLDKDLDEVIRHSRENKDLHLTRYKRNFSGNITEIEDALGHIEYYMYDENGRVKEKKDRDDYITAYSYDHMDRIKEIKYDDGRSVRYSYDALARLEQVEDWLGITRIVNDVMGRTMKVTDYKNHEISYEWGSMGERKSITYPDGTKILYEYDEALHLHAVRKEGKENSFEITYLYDEGGRLREKQMSDGTRTLWNYNETGLLRELCHEDKQGILDRYQYTYDLMGNKTEIIKERRGLEIESGSYSYQYDVLNRLTGVEKDGKMVRTYVYDAFGNRTEMMDYCRDRQEAYTYNALNQLLEINGIHRKYRYDNRGNMIEESMENFMEGQLLHGYEYDVTNRLTRAWNGSGEEAFYQYNGIGQRIVRKDGEAEEEYIFDPTKSYNNLLNLTDRNRTKNFYWDGNVAVMEGTQRSNIGLSREMNFILQDELGSSIRMTGNKQKVYGYDEFGKDLYQELKEADIPNSYNRQGEGQPFGYTGYRYDYVSGTYFAQAREYKTSIGRFGAEDVMHGFLKDIRSVNKYTYVINMPLILADYNGLWPEWIDVSEEGAARKIEENSEYIIEAAEIYGVDPQVVAGVIYAEQSQNVNIIDTLTDWISFYGIIDMSVGIGQVRLSTAELLEEKGYIKKTEAEEGGWNLGFLGFVHGTTTMAREKRLEDNRINIMYAAAYIKLIEDYWSDAFPDIVNRPDILATLYNQGYDYSNPHSNPGSNSFGEYVLENYDKMGELLGIQDMCE